MATRKDVIASQSCKSAIPDHKYKKDLNTMPQILCLLTSKTNASTTEYI